MMHKLVCTAFLAAALGAEVSTEAPQTLETATPAPVQPIVDLIVELSSSKSVIWKVEYDEQKKDADIEQLPGKGKTRVDLLMRNPPLYTFKKGLGGACNTRMPQKWSTELKCQQHIARIMELLQNARNNDDFTIRNISFLATAGLRQSYQKHATLGLLRDAMNKKMEEWGCPQAEDEDEDKQEDEAEAEDRVLRVNCPKIKKIRPMRGDEEAMHETIALAMLLRETPATVKDANGNDVPNTDHLAANEPFGVIGLGGSSLQYGMLTPDEAVKVGGKKTIHTDSKPAGLDKMWLEMQINNPDACTILTNVVETRGNRYDDCKKALGVYFNETSIFGESTIKDLWKEDALKVYVIGGIKWAIRDYQPFGGTENNDVSLNQLIAAAKDLCTPYPLDGTAVVTQNGVEYEKTKKAIRTQIVDGVTTYKADGYYRLLCLKYSLLVYALEKDFDVPGTKTLHFRNKINDEDAQWVKSAASHTIQPIEGTDETGNIYVDTYNGKDVMDASVQWHEDSQEKYEETLRQEKEQEQEQEEEEEEEVEEEEGEVPEGGRLI